jgi:hypothetical protein
MKLISLLSLFFCVLAMPAQTYINGEKPKEESDAVYIRENAYQKRWTEYPQGTGPIVFRNDACGKIEKLGNDSFVFYPDRLNVLESFWISCPATHFPPNLFSDCVYFDPVAGFAENPLQERATRESIIFSRVDSTALLINAAYRVPASFRMYLDTSRVQTDYADRLVADTILAKEVAPYIQPFYFRKYEVSNKEYKEFVSWVRDSIARLRLGYVTANGKPDWAKKIDWADTTIQNKSGLYLKAEERFWHRKEIDTRLLVYQFKNVPAEYGVDTLPIYPDTLSWVHDWEYSFNEPMTNMYFWHPAYDDCPVVGVNYWQCFAFLEWKTKQLQQQFNKEGKKYRVVCALPTDAQWDMVSTAAGENGKPDLFPEQYDVWSDNLWLTDLQLQSAFPKGFTLLAPQKKEAPSVLMVWTPRESMKYYPYSSSPDQMIREEDRTYAHLKEDGYFHTGPVNPNLKVRSPWDAKIITKEFQKTNAHYVAHTDKATGICYLDGNVSEWIANDLDSCWRPVFTKHLVLPQGPLNESANAARQVENHYFKQLPSRGKLIRGSNWYDERFNLKYEKNTAGMNAKTFEDPSKAHCTVGFRYVIYVYPQ